MIMNATLFKRFTLLIVFLFTGTIIFAQTTQVLSLDSAIGMSLKNSSVLRGSRARIEEATAAIREASERQLPDVKVSGSYLRVSNPTINLKTGKATGSGGTDTATTSSAIKVNQ